MSKQHSKVSPHRFWIGLFSCWVLLLSGVFSSWFGGPGLLQWWRLERLLSQKQAHLTEVENEVLALSSEQTRLERSPATQHREIRRVLGYVRPDEMVFDFSAEMPSSRVLPVSDSETTVARR
ncbi:MAG: Septum formation initiator [Pseudomonadota bacterium]|jgi:cell division protein FtsB